MTTSPFADAHEARPDSAIIGRRTLVKGGAWAVPVVVASAHAPALAASCVMTTFNASTPSASSAAAGISTFTVPAGVTRIQFAVVGGAGAAQSGGRSGGAGARVTGELSVSPGMMLQLVVGQGGNRLTNSAGTGGQGFGNGGNPGVPPQPTASTSFYGAGGGGGSAILIGTMPVIVAGGGGGAGTGANVTGQSVAYTVGPYGGDAGAAATDAVLSWNNPSPSRTARSYGGEPAVASTGGAGGVASTVNDTTPGNGRAVDSAAGSSGGNYVAGVGGNGGRGAATSFPQVTPGYVAGGSSGGGGGGGYAGGGGGGSVAVTYVSPTGVICCSSGGGGGSSYASPAAVGGVTVISSAVGTGPNSNATTSRVAGSIALTYCRPV